MPLLRSQEHSGPRFAASERISRVQAVNDSVMQEQGGRWGLPPIFGHDIGVPELNSSHLGAKYACQVAVGSLELTR